MPNLLKLLELDELSLVDRPANPLAMAPLYKREDNMDELEKLKVENERLRKSLIDNGFVIKADVIEKKVEPETIEINGEMVIKSDIPAPVLKALEQAEIEKKEAEEKAEKEALQKRATEKLPNFEERAAVSLFKVYEDAPEDEQEAIMAALDAADKAFDAAMKEHGKKVVDGDLTDPVDKLDELAKAYASEKKVTYEKAYTEVTKTDEGKSLIKEIYKKD